MNRRAGVTLTEVLVAIFVTGLGLMSLMTLFPLGALNMAQAVKDDRTAAASGNATGYFRAWWRVQLQQGNDLSQTDPTVVAAMLNGLPAGATTVSNPVYLDPVGLNALGATVAGGNIQRIRPSWAPDITTTRQFFTYLDDYEFNVNGIPRTGGAEVERRSKYSWAYMVRRLRANDPRVLEFSVVVYEGRSTLQPQSESLYTANFNTATNTVTLSGYASRPKVRKGTWVLDAVNGYFYRVVDVRDGVTAGTIDLEVQNPFRGVSGAGQVAVLTAIAEVFDRSTAE